MTGDGASVDLLSLWDLFFGLRPPCLTPPPPPPLPPYDAPPSRSQELSANVRVLRITRDGDLYTAKYAVRDALPALAPACARLKKKKQKRAAACALAAQLATEPQLQAEMRPIEPFEAPASVPQSSNTSAAAPPQPSSSFGAASSPQPPLSRRLRLRALQAAAVTRHRHELQALRRALLQHGNVSSSSSSGGRDDADADADALQRRRLADWGIIGNDDRADCPAKQYPYTAAGQLTMGDTDGSASGPRPFLCSAALIGPDVILTAAHCVFDRNTRAFYRDVLFAPGRYRLAATGSVSPFGAASWLDITIYSDFTSRPPDGAYPAQVLPWDVALIRLDRSVGLQAGWLGLRATCGSDEGGTGGSVSVTSAGYPSDYNYGACVTSGCTMSGECGKREWRHTCDTAQGQSGSPLWAQLPVAPGARKKGPFIRGLVIASTRTQNVALALTPFHAANVLFWARARGSLA